MAKSHPDDALDALLTRYVPGSMLDSTGTAELIQHARRLRAERDKAIEDARYLCECAALLLHGGDALIEDVAQNAYDDVRRQVRRMFDPLRLSDVMGRYVDVDVEPARAAEVSHG